MAFVMSCAEAGCGYVAANHDDYVEHSKRVHGLFACSEIGCFRTYRSFQSLGEHHEVHHLGRRVWCTACSLDVGTDRSRFSKHVKAVGCGGKLEKRYPIDDSAVVGSVADAVADVADLSSRASAPVVVPSGNIVVLSDLLVVPARAPAAAVVTKSAIADAVDAALASVQGTSNMKLISPLASTPSTLKASNVARAPDGTVLGSWVDEGDNVVTLRVSDDFMAQLLAVEEGEEDEPVEESEESAGDVEGADEDDGDVGGEYAEDEGKVVDVEYVSFLLLCCCYVVS